MNLFIRLKSNSRYAINLDGVLRDTLNLHQWSNAKESRTHSYNDIKPNKDGNHILLIGNTEESYSMPCAALIDEIKQISNNTGISLTHGK
jgi:hypothetical protein